MGCQASSVVRSEEKMHVAKTQVGKTPSDSALMEKAKPEQGDFHRDYVLEKKLGQGAFGSVFSAKAVADGRSGRSVAVKVMNFRADGQGEERAARLRVAAQREVANLRRLPRSANVVQFVGYYAADGLAYMVMENGGAGLLRALESVEMLNEKTLQPVFRDMLLGIGACHAAGIVHRDVKPDNFLAAPTARGLTVKLCDFGLASRVRDVEAPELEGVFGTPPFMAPEMLGGRRYSAKVDVWALGVLAYVLLYGAWPYMPTVMSGQAMKAAILVGNPAPRFSASPSVPKLSKPCSDWVRALLQREVSSRPSAQAALRLSNSTAWSSESSMRPALGAAKRVGAFDMAPGGRQPPSDLDRLLSQLNTAAQACAAQVEERPSNWMSEASTAADSRVSPC